MGITWNMSAAIATVVLLLVFGSIFNKMKSKKDSPLYAIAQKFKRKKQEDTMIDETIHYKRLPHRNGVKW